MPMLLHIIAAYAAPKRIRQGCALLRWICLVLFLGLVLACASKPTSDEDQAAIPAPKAAETQTRIEYIPFETDTLYALLVAEMAGGRSRLDIMLSNYVQQAEITRDPGIVARASRLARFLNAPRQAVEMSLLWAALEPENKEAHLNAAASLIATSDFAGAFDHSRFLLEQGEKNTGLDTLGANAARAAPHTAEFLRDQYLDLYSNHKEHGELKLGLAYLQRGTGNLDAALLLCDKILKETSDKLPAAALRASIYLQQEKAELALQSYEALVAQHPENTRLRLQYARLLSRQDLAKAATQFELLKSNLPQDPDITLALGLVYFEHNQFEKAEENLITVRSSRNKAIANYYLGLIATKQQRAEDAIAYFSAVPPSKEYKAALSNIVDLYMQSERADTALSFIAARRQDTALDPKEQGYLLELRVLNALNRDLEAWERLNAGLAAHPESATLRYARAMQLTQRNEIASAIEDLKYIVSKNPKNAVALNALGYTLADRTDRLSEAQSYILRAYKLAPENGAIIDSLGWVHYRLGDVATALEYLEKAFAIMKDHEVAAHLGEVLWVMERKSEARKIWQEGFKLNPGSPIINETIKRLRAE